MKKLLKSILISFCLFHFQPAWAQVTFRQFNSFEELINTAQKEQKLIFIQIMTDKCNNCNEIIIKKGFV